MTQQIPFSKIQSTGNDFIFLNASDLAAESLNADLVIKMCERKVGIGADGLVLVDFESGEKPKWTFYNSDGNSVDMCGNAARAMIYYMHLFSSQNNMSLQNNSVISFESNIGQVSGEITEKGKLSCRVSVEIQLPNGVSSNVTETQLHPQYSGELIDTGVLHFVVNVDAIEDIKSKASSLANYIFDKSFPIEGANLTFYKKEDVGISAVTFERGVNDFTLACGTGAIAAAIVYSKKQTSNSCENLPVKMPGGELQVSNYNNKAVLNGWVNFVYRGIYEII